MLVIALLVATIVQAQAVPKDAGNVHGNVDAGTSEQFDHARRILRDGYHSETHRVLTRDGYRLEVVRIPYKRFQFWGNPLAKKKPVAFLMHGLQGSSISFITLGATRSLAYNLVEAGFDVWIGNARGIVNSRDHLVWNPDYPSHAEKFFDYSFEDVATKDLPSMINYVLRVTRQEKLHYIGHSQGGTAFLVLNSLRPEFNDKFLTADLLAGVGYQDHFPTKIIEDIAKRTDLIYGFARRIGLMEIGHISRNDIIQYNQIDSDDTEAATALNLLLDILDGILMLGRLEVVAGASLKQYAHYGQNIRDKAFRRWNYGAVGNLWRYGSFEPPTYDISRITVDLTLHYAMSDVLLSEQDVLNMAKDIPNAKARRVARDSFGHMDFVISNDSKELVTDYIVDKLSNLYL